MTSPIPPWIAPLAQAFEAQGAALYLVGGAVRNALLGMDATDFDACGALLPKAAQALAIACGYEARVRSCELGTVEIGCVQGRLEYTPFRVESYASGGEHRPARVQFTDSLTEDAMRRDFTINALYAHAGTGEVLDPCGGIPDLARGTLRACRPCAHHTMRDDGLRILRMVRFAGELQFAPDSALMEAARANARNLLDLSPTRIFGEWQRICLCDTRYPASGQGPEKLLYAMDLLHQCGAMQVLCPELCEGIGVLQAPRYHAHDVYGHNLHTFAAAPPELDMRLAGLLHDVAKPRRAHAQNGKMYGHEVQGAEMAQAILARLGVPDALRGDVCTLIARHMFDLTGQAKESTLRVRFCNWGFAFVRKLICMRQCDIAGSGRPAVHDTTVARWQRVLDTLCAEGAIDDIRQLRIDGTQIMRACGIGPGPRVGRIKQLLFEQCAQDPRRNEPQRLMREAQRLCRQLPKDRA